MTKYSEFMSDDKQYHSVLTAIANELAEANRLKRLELKHQAAIRVGVVYDREEREQMLKEINAELEDKA